VRGVVASHRKARTTLPLYRMKPMVGREVHFWRGFAIYGVYSFVTVFTTSVSSTVVESSIVARVC
jgi:hypothetical protein